MTGWGQDGIYWQAQQVDASGRIILERLGNNLFTTRAFDAMGRPRYIQTGKFGITPDIQNLNLEHDQNGNLTSRDDYVTGRGDSFVYDELDRLTLDLRTGDAILSYQYDAIGNITYKSDVGSYFYGTKPHAVTRTNGNFNNTLAYDLNGNQTLGLNNRAVTYTAFNIPSKIVQGTNVVLFDYDANHERFRQIGPNGTTIYLNPRIDLGGHFEQTDYAGTKESRHTIYAAGKAIAEVVTRPNGYKQTRYFHTDHLGSIDAVTDDNAVVLARYAFDPFGNRTSLYGNAHISRHGFTGHEHLPEVGLIHMNGRVYDPTLGRFLTADPYIQFPDNLQSYNRYSYVMNNPLVFTDPSGYGLFGSIGKFFKKLWDNPIVRIGVTIAVAYFTGVYVGGLLTTSGASWAVATGGGLTWAGSAVAGAASGFAAGFVGSGGNLRYAAIGAATGGFAGGLNAYFSTSAWYERAFAAGVGGGVSARAFGGDFGRGFEYAFLASLGKTALDTYVQKMWPQNSSYDSSLKPASENSVQKPSFALVKEAGDNTIGSCSLYGGACGPITSAQTGSAFETSLKSLIGTAAPSSTDILSRYENSPVLQFLSKNVPGVQAFSITHDVAMGHLQVIMNNNLLFMPINVSTIPVFAYAQYQALGLGTTEYQLRLMRH